MRSILFQIFRVCILELQTISTGLTQQKINYKQILLESISIVDFYVILAHNKMWYFKLRIVHSRIITN